MLALITVRVTISLVLLAGLLTPGPPGAPPSASAVPVARPAGPIIEPPVPGALPQDAPGCVSPCESRLVVLRDQVDLKPGFGRTRAQRQRNLIAALRAKADSAQRPLIALLKVRLNEGLVTSFTPLWIQNAILVRGQPTIFDELARLPGVDAIVPERTIEAPAIPEQVAATAEVDAVSPVEPNIELINAPALWDRGFLGDGVVVAMMDTGVDGTHPELAAQFRGGTNSWYDPYGQHPKSPYDRNGHGTWSTGIIVGGSASGSSIGVAPQAKWIAVKIFNDRNQATTSAIHQGYQWLLDPDSDPNTPDAPDVVNNSWTYGAPGCNLEFQPDLAVLAAAGIVSVFAAGNFGPDGQTDASPANNPAALSAGATDAADGIYSGSSRGETSCGSTTRTYPDLVAPGVDVLTTDLYGLYTRVTGTSAAAPHVAGSLALLLGAFPELTVDQQRAALLSTAHDLGVAGPDNTFGAGRLDVMAAYESLNTNSGPVFSDSFESGDFSAWTASQTDGGRLVITTTAALSGTLGLRARLDGGAPVFVTDASPAAEARYNARFYYSAAAAALPRGLPHALFGALDATGGVAARVEVQSMSRQIQVRAVAQSAGADVATQWYLINRGKHALEVAWSAANSPGAVDGQLTFYIDGVAQTTLSGLGNGDQRIEEGRLGPYAGAPQSTWGDEYFDAFASTRGAVIGP